MRYEEILRDTEGDRYKEIPSDTMGYRAIPRETDSTKMNDNIAKDIERYREKQMI